MTSFNPINLNKFVSFHSFSVPYDCTKVGRKLLSPKLRLPRTASQTIEMPSNKSSKGLHGSFSVNSEKPADVSPDSSQFG